MYVHGCKKYLNGTFMDIDGALHELVDKWEVQKVLLKKDHTEMVQLLGWFVVPFRFGNLQTGANKQYETDI